MADSFPGGAYQNAAGDWFNAIGEPLTSEARTKAIAHAAELTKQRQAADDAQRLADAQRDPVMRAFLAQQAAAPKAPEPVAAKRT